MRYRLPDGCAGVSIAGVVLEPDAAGIVEADAALAEDLASHGILPVEARVSAGSSPASSPKRRGRP